jgi:ubiquinone/menaquinone biosynthesis C-methylase UbiE
MAYRAAHVKTGVNAHKAVVREEFTRQAEAYAKAEAITNAQRLERLVTAINPARDARALEVATGPGYVAMALAAACREMVGLDLTPAPIAIAERNRRERGLENVRFQVGDAENLPFSNGEFDIVVCRFAFHHFEDPGAILSEMCRVCRPSGTVVVEDLFSSEDAERAAYYNRVENLRDHSHTRALALSDLIGLMGRAGVEIETVYSDRLIADVDTWLASAQTSAIDADAARRMLEEDGQRDLSGARPFVREGKIYFVQRTVALIGRKLAAAPN